VGEGKRVIARKGPKQGPKQKAKKQAHERPKTTGKKQAYVISLPFGNAERTKQNKTRTSGSPAVWSSDTRGPDVDATWSAYELEDALQSRSRLSTMHASSSSRRRSWGSLSVSTASSASEMGYSEEKAGDGVGVHVVSAREDDGGRAWCTRQRRGGRVHLNDKRRTDKGRAGKDYACQ